MGIKAAPCPEPGCRETLTISIDGMQGEARHGRLVYDFNRWELAPGENVACISRWLAAFVHPDSERTEADA